MAAIGRAAAGLHRRGRHARITTYLDPMFCVPAGGQGALAIECREDDADIMALLALFEHPPTRRAVIAERAFLQAMQGGCHAPIGVYAVIQGDTSLALTGAVGDVTDGVVLQHTVYGDDPLVLAESLRTWMIHHGAPFGQRQGT
jgi:hydroxymethylbilane synthase